MVEHLTENQGVGGSSPPLPTTPRPTAPGRRREARINLVIGLLSLIWGTTYFVVRQGLQDLAPFTAAGARFVLAALVFAALTPWLSRRERGERPTWTQSVMMGLFNFAIPYGIVYSCQAKLPSGLTSVLWATFPLMIAIATRFFLPSIELTARQWFGFLVGFLGVLVLFFTDLSNLGEDGALYGAVLLLSPAFATVGQIYVKRYANEVSSVLMTRNGLLVAAPLLCLTGVVFESASSSHWSTGAVLSVIYLALVGTVIAFGFYFWALRYSAPHKLGLITYLTPSVALVVGSVFGDEPFHWHTLFGTGLILGSVGLVMARRARAAGGTG